MPMDFERCVKAGGRVRTLKMPGGKFMHICYDAKGPHRGEVKKKKQKVK